MYLECRAHHTLYESGGLADQPAALWYQMNAAYTIWSDMLDWRKAKSRVEWSNENPARWKNVQLVLKLREQDAPAAD